MKAKDLKNSILQMAVQGKLVPQDPSDESASALLERIRAERTRLIKEKKIKAPRGGESVIYLGSDGSRYEKRVDAKGHESEPICIDDEIPFEIPEGWEWARLEAVLSLASGLGYKKPDLAVKGDCMIRVYRGGNIGLRDNPVPKDNDVMISSEFVDDSLILHDGQIITPAVTSLENVGKAALVQGADGKTVCGGFVFYLTPLLEDSTFSEYLFRYLSSQIHVGYCKTNVKKSGQAFYNLSKVALNKALIPIPPLAEQRRITGRVSELMPLVEEYGKLEDEREVLDSALPERLRKSVLQMAIVGKLIVQDPADEPASALLNRIRTERARLIAEKKIKAPKGGESVIYLGSDGRRYEKRGKGESVCIDDEIPFEIPESWEWARLATCCKDILVPQRDKPQSFDGEIPWCRIEDIEGLMLSRSKMGRGVSLATVKKMNLKINPVGTILCSNSATIGVPAIVKEPLVTNQRFIGFVCNEALLNRYLYWVFLANHNYLCGVGTGTTQSYISRATFEEMLIPIPPLAEQHRIVAQLDNLLVIIA